MRNKFTLRLFSLLALVFAALILFPDQTLAAKKHRRGHVKKPSMRRGTLITNITIVSPEREGNGTKGEVLVHNGKILGVFTSRQQRPAGNFEIVDGGGRFLTPGWIDGHVHLGAVPGMNFEQQKAAGTLTESYFNQLPRSYLYYGFTTLVDLNVVDRTLINQIQKAPNTPDIFDCDGALVLANGYPMNYASPHERFEKFPNFVVDKGRKGKIPSSFKIAEHTPEASVQRAKNNGAICIKTHYEPGFGNQRDLPVMSSKLFQEIMVVSHLFNLPVLVHANSATSQRFAVDGGADAIVHGLWNWPKEYKSWRSGEPLPKEISGVLDDLITKHIGYAPTIRVLGGLADLFDDEFLNRPDLKNVLPQALIDWYRTEAGSLFRKEILEGREVATARQDYQQALARLAGVVNYLAAKNAWFVFGSDTPSAPTYGNPPGYNGYAEILQWQAMGVPLKEIFRALTIQNAELFHKSMQLGSIEPDKRANLLLLDKNPLETIEAYDAIEAVIIGGKWLERESLKAEADTN